MTTAAKKAFDEWKGLTKVSLVVYTDQQMFEIGFNKGQEMVKELLATLDDMEEELKLLQVENNKLRKAPKKMRDSDGA